MDFRIRHFAAALVMLGAGIQASAATEPRTWYVYCEGASANGHWAVFSENLWLHPETGDYGQRVGGAAKAFFESRHDLALEGCAGVAFRNDSLAEHSRTLTVQLHRKMGDRIYFLPLPAEVLPGVTPLASVVAAAAPAGGNGLPAQGGDQHDGRGWAPSAAPR
jgi:hypothetical protein